MNYMEEYKQKLVTAEEAVKLIQSGDWVDYGWCTGTVDALDKAQQDGSFSDDEAVKAFEYLYSDGGLLDRILINDIKTEDWMMLMKAAKYDDMIKENEAKVAEAREEGEIAGRNANIDIQKKKKSQVQSMPSSIPSNGSVKPAQKKDKFLSMLDEKTKSVWD